MSKCSDGPIGVFDSGIGGLSVLRALRELLPHENFLYLGDTARLPYGTRGDDTIIQYSLECGRYLVQRGAKMIVGACNTASSIAGEVLQRELPVPFVGTVEPSLRCVTEAGLGRSLWILGTEGTVRSGAYQRRLQGTFTEDFSLHAIACPLFVPIAEEGLVSGPITDAVIDLYLSAVKGSGAEAVLLACTHYPMLAGAIASYLGPDTRVLDGSAAIAREVESILGKERIGRSSQAKGESVKGNLTCLVTDGAPRVDRLARQFLGNDSVRVSVVSVEAESAGGNS